MLAKSIEDENNSDFGYNYTNKLFTAKHKDSYFFSNREPHLVSSKWNAECHTPKSSGQGQDENKN